MPAPSPNNRPACRSYATLAAMPAAPLNGSVAWSIADVGFAVFAGGVWGLVALPVIPPGTITQAMIVPASLDATVAKVLADNAVIGGLACKMTVDVPDGATGDVNVVSTHKIRVLDAHLIKKAGAGGMMDTIQVKNGANAITDAMSINVGDTTVVRAGTIDDAQYDIAAGGTLRITRTKVSIMNTACQVVIDYVRVA